MADDGLLDRLSSWVCVHPDNPLRRFMIGYYVVGLAGLAVAIGLRLAGFNWVWVFLAALVAATVPVVLPIIAFVTFPYVRNVRGIRRGDYLAHWQYRNDEWARFGQHVEHESRRLMRLSPLFGGVLGLFAGGLAWLGSRDLSTALLMYGIIQGLSLVVALQYWFEGRAQRTVHGDVYINTQGVLRPQGYLPISGLNISLVDIHVELAPTGVTIMRFTIGSLTERLEAREQSFSIPVPDGCEDEAAALATRLLPGGRTDDDVTSAVGSGGASGARGETVDRIFTQIAVRVTIA